MKNLEILKKFKQFADSLSEDKVELSEEVVETVEETKEEVVLAEETPEEPKKEATPVAEPAPVVVEFATKKEFEEMKNKVTEELSEVKAMFEQILDRVKPSYGEVPQELSKEEVELSEEIVHSPEAETKEVKKVLHSQGRQMTTRDRVFNKISNLKK